MKKFLSLVLALVMAMSLVTVSAGAKDFNDSDKISDITYEEAVNVMSEMGIIDGYADGSFQPQGTLTRGAAAKIIACMMLGKTTAESLGTQAAPFKDVPVGSTFAGYIAYCSESGIIDGYSDGTFRPANTLTGFAFLKMLLTALGYDSAIEGYANNPNWTVNVAGRAKQVGLLNGNDNFVGTRAATREEACLYAVNTLKATLVEYESKGSSITINGAVISSGASNATYVTSNVYNQATSIDATKDNAAGDWTVEFAEKYQPDLTLKGTTDAFGRPAHIWTWKNDEIGTYVDYDKMIAEYTEKVTGRDLYDLLGKAALDECDVYTYVDGETTRSVLGSAYFTENNIVRDNDEKVGATGDGVLTQVFHDTKNDVITITVINTYLAKAEEDYNEKNDDVDLMVYAIKDGGTKQYVKDTKAKTELTVEGEDFAIEDVTEDQLFLVTVADGKIQTIADPEILSEASISKFSEGKYVISGGTQYDYASTAMYDPEVLDVYTGEDNNAVVNLKDLSYNIILDPYGYMIGVELNEDPAQYLFLTGLDSGASNLGASNADANVIFTDGKMDTVTVNMRKSEAFGGGKLTEGSQLNTWCSYTVNSDGVYTLKEVATATADAAHKAYTTMQSSTNVGSVRNAATGDYEKASVSIDKKHITLDGLNGADPKDPDYVKVYGDDESIYINVELAAVSARSNADTWIIDDVESVTVGIANTALNVEELGDVTATSGVVDDTVWDKTTKKNYEMPTDEIYTLFDDEGYVIAAVVIGENQGTTTNFAYITSSRVNSEEYKGDDDLWIFTREAIVGGKLVELTEVGDAVDVLDELDQGDWYKIKYDADGYVRGYEEIETSLANTDIEDGYIDDVANVEAACEAKDLVLLDQDLTTDIRPVNNYLSFRNGSLYVTTDDKEGFYVSPDVKVALSLADQPGTAPNAGNAFDEIIDSYEGRSGLEKALRNLDTDAVDRDGDGAVEYPFNGMLSVVFENGVATSIVLDDRSGVLATDYNPMEAKVINVTLVDYVTNRTLAVDKITVERVNGADVVSNSIAAVTPKGLATDYEAYLKTLWGTTYTAVPSTQSVSLAYVEGQEVNVTFIYKETASTEMSVIVNLVDKDDTSKVLGTTLATGTISGSIVILDVEDVPLDTDMILADSGLKYASTANPTFNVKVDELVTVTVSADSKITTAVPTWSNITVGTMKEDGTYPITLVGEATADWSAVTLKVTGNSDIAVDPASVVVTAGAGANSNVTFNIKASADIVSNGAITLDYDLI